MVEGVQIQMHEVMIHWFVNHYNILKVKETEFQKCFDGKKVRSHAGIHES